MSGPGGSGRAAGQGAQVRPSQKDSHRRWEPWAGLHFHSLGDFFFEINIEKRASHPQPHPRARPWLSAAGWLREASLVLGGECGAQVGPADPLRQRLEAPACRGWGWGGRGCGRPCYCWQEVAPFFPDGETEAQGGFFFFFFFGTLPKSLTVSQLLGRAQLTRWGTRSYGPRSPPPLGRQGRAEGPGQPGGGYSAALRGWGRGAGAGRSGEGLCLALGRAKSSAGERGGGHSGENRVFWQDGHPLQNLGSKGQRGCSQPRRGPRPLQVSLVSPAAPRKDPGDPGGLLGETPPLLRGRGGDAPALL